MGQPEGWSRFVSPEGIDVGIQKAWDSISAEVTRREAQPFPDALLLLSNSKRCTLAVQLEAHLVPFFRPLQLLLEHRLAEKEWRGEGSVRRGGSHVSPHGHRAGVILNVIESDLVSPTFTLGADDTADASAVP